MTLSWQDIKNTPPQNKWGSLYSAGIGSNTANVQADPNPQSTQKISSKFNKYLGPVTSILSPIENVVDSVIRKDPNKNFGQRLKESFSRGSDIGGALVTRGMNPALAMPLGFMGSLAIPGAGEFGQVKHLSKLDDLGKAINKSDDLIDSTGSFVGRILKTRNSREELNKAIDVLSNDKSILKDVQKAENSIIKLGEKFIGEDEVRNIITNKKMLQEDKLNKIADLTRKTIDKTFDNTGEIKNFLKPNESSSRYIKGEKGLFKGSKANETTDEIQNFLAGKKSVQPSIPEVKGKGLIEEARKYKSAEDFIKSQQMPIFKDKTPFDLNLDDARPVLGDKLETTKKNIAEGRLSRSGNAPLIVRKLSKGYEITDGTHRWLEAKNKGITSLKAVEYSGETTKELNDYRDLLAKTRTQLTDIWNKSQSPSIPEVKLIEGQIPAPKELPPLYRGQKSNTGGFSENKVGAMYASGPSVSVNKNQALQYGDVSEVTPAKDAKIAWFNTAFDMGKSIQDDAEKLWGSQYRYNTPTPEIITRWLKEKGYDAVMSKNGEGVIVNIDKFKIK